MKKIPLIIGIFLHIIYYVFALLSLGDYEYAGYGVGKAFAFWIYAMVISFLVVVLYLLDGISSITSCRNTFNIIKLISVIVIIPIDLFIGASAGVTESIIWNSCFFALFIFEISSLFVKRNRSN